jgi:hypothetical protein
MGARWYNPQTATFTSRDTYPGSVGAYATLNRYTYGLNNPLKYSDPTGHMNYTGDDGSETSTAGIAGLADALAALAASTARQNDPLPTPVTPTADDLAVMVGGATGITIPPTVSAPPTTTATPTPTGDNPPSLNPDQCDVMDPTSFHPDDEDCIGGSGGGSDGPITYGTKKPKAKPKIYSVLPNPNELDPGELKHQKEIEKWAKKNGINPLLLAALMYHEGGEYIGSAARRQVMKRADRRSSSKGMMQIQIKTAETVLKEVYGEAVPTNLEDMLIDDDDFSLKIAAGYLKYLQDKYDIQGDRQLFVAYAVSPNSIKALKEVNFNPDQLSTSDGITRGSTTEVLGSTRATIIRRNDVHWTAAVQAVTNRVR